MGPAFVIAGVAFVCILLRPFRVAEAWWALAGAALLVAFGFVSLPDAWRAVLRGGDVYLFLLGMLLLAEILRSQGVFERLAALALRAAGASQALLFVLVFAVGAGVTVFFSNDATAVVLTRAVAAVVARTRVSPYPYLFTCAFVANAASFVLPISNPANLVVFGGALPRLDAWLGAFLLPSVLAIGLTFAVLAIAHSSRLRERLTPAATGSGNTERPNGRGEESAAGRGEGRAERGEGRAERGGDPAGRGEQPAARSERVAGVACGIAAMGLVGASLAGAPLGAWTFGLALAALVAVSVVQRDAWRSVPAHLDYAIVPLVAGLFVIVAALDRAGGLELVRSGFLHAQTLHAPFAALAVGGAVALASNLLNNLPVGLGAASAFDAHTSSTLRHAVLVGVDLGPNVALSGSLATLLWMQALRREGVAMDALRFLRSGVVVALPALLAALLSVR